MNEQHAELVEENSFDIEEIHADQKQKWIRSLYD